MQTLKLSSIAPEILALFNSWSVPTAEYTRELVTYANTLLLHKTERIGDVVISFGYADRDEIEKLAKNKPTNTFFLEYISEKIDNVRQNAQLLLAANERLAYYASVPAASIHGDFHLDTVLRDYCQSQNCLPLYSNNEAILRLVFANYTQLKTYREQPRIVKINDPLGNLCKERGLSIVYAVADSQVIFNYLYKDDGDNATVAENEDKLTIWNAADAETDNQRLLARMLSEAVTKKATNIKFTPLNNGTMEIQYRRHGDLRPFENIRPISPEEADEIVRFLHTRAAARYTATNKRVESRLLTPADGHMVFRTGTSETFLRAGFIPAGNDSLNLQRESISIRLLDRNAVTIRLESLNLAPPVINEIQTFLRQKHGLLLVVGPTSSGKSTTVAGCVTAYRDIYGNTRNLMSLEQPIERPLEGITQVQVGQSNFEMYMAALLRHDPNFIWVGEIRDRPSGSTCVRAANTGQIVVSTIHADDSTLAPNALLSYISNMAGSSADSVIVTPYDAINALSLIIAQRLVPELCPHCRIPLFPNKNEQDPEKRKLELIRFEEHTARYRAYCARNEVQEKDIANSFLRRAEGCGRCDNEGYAGERPINEILPVTRQLRRKLTALINSHEFDNEVLAVERSYTLHDDAMRHVLAGTVSISDALI